MSAFNAYADIINHLFGSGNAEAIGKKIGEGFARGLAREAEKQSTGPSWLPDAAKALGQIAPDGTPLALNWNEVLREITEQRQEKDRLAAQVTSLHRQIEGAVNVGALIAGTCSCGRFAIGPGRGRTWLWREDGKEHGPWWCGEVGDAGRPS